MKACPQCKQQFHEADEYCPDHGLRLLSLQPVPNPPVESTEHSYDHLVAATLDGRYRLEQKLGEGGMGVVFLGTHTLIDKPVAIKVLKREVARDQSVVKRFEQEAKAASRIGHPNIIDVTDFGKLPDGSVYSVMEYVPGQTLARVLRDGPMSVARALPIVAQLGRALAAAHEKGVVHRDLKPENIFLVDRDGRKDFVKIVDFGIAKMASEAADKPRITRAGAVFGTPEYMAPEQAAGRPDTDHRVDVYALGTILYEMLVGCTPHRSDAAVTTLAMQLLDPIRPPREAAPDRDIDPALEQVVLKALAKDRDQRYGSMTELLEALEVAAGGIPLDPVVGAGSQRAFVDSAPREASAAVPLITPTPPRTRGRLMLVIVGGLIAAAAVAVVFSRGGRDSEHQEHALPMVPQASAPDAADPSRFVAPPLPTVPRRDAQDAASPSSLRDAGHTRPRRSESVEIPTPPERLGIVVHTDPPGAELRVGGAPAGRAGTMLFGQRGTSSVVECRAQAHEAGNVTLVFDGAVREMTCRMRRSTKCVEGLKNPYGDCPP